MTDDEKEQLQELPNKENLSTRHQKSTKVLEIS